MHQKKKNEGTRNTQTSDLYNIKEMSMKVINELRFFVAYEFTNMSYIYILLVYEFRG